MLTTLWLQKDLNFLGYNAGPEDDDYGSKTTAAVKRFQEDFKLAVDGIAGPDTCGRLERVIKECQKILNVSQDGLAGTNTKEAYNRFNGIEHFKYGEFTCHCGCGYNTVDIRLVKILDEIRNHYDLYLQKTFHLIPNILNLKELLYKSSILSVHLF